MHNRCALVIGSRLNRLLSELGTNQAKCYVRTLQQVEVRTQSNLRTEIHFRTKAKLARSCADQGLLISGSTRESHGTFSRNEPSLQPADEAGGE